MSGVGIAAIEDLQQRLNVTFHTWQIHAFDHAYALATHKPENQQRFCLYYKTGSGKTITALVALYLMGYEGALVITPPSTYPAWYEQAKLLDLDIECISHAKFRQQGYKVSRKRPIIADEFHMFGGHSGKGWKKFATMSRGLQAPIILASATPNYNDAERVYCIEHVLDPVGTKGGYLEFIYRHCETKYNPHSQTPDVVGFLHYPHAKDYLAALPNVLYLPDDLVYSIHDDYVQGFHEQALAEYGYSRRTEKMIASQIGERHEQVAMNFVGVNNVLRRPVEDYLMRHLSKDKTLLIYCTHSKIAEVVYDWMQREEYGCELLTGDTSEKNKARIIAEFNAGRIKTLIGTATLGTGTDGMDKVCHRMILLDDTDDPAFRRQLIGRIMPRGKGGLPASAKEVRRLNFG